MIYADDVDDAGMIKHLRDLKGQAVLHGKEDFPIFVTLSRGGRPQMAAMVCGDRDTAIEVAQILGAGVDADSAMFISDCRAFVPESPDRAREVAEKMAGDQKYLAKLYAAGDPDVVELISITRHTKDGRRSLRGMPYHVSRGDKKVVWLDHHPSAKTMKDCDTAEGRIPDGMTSVFDASGGGVKDKVDAIIAKFSAGGGDMSPAALRYLAGRAAAWFVRTCTPTTVIDYRDRPAGVTAPDLSGMAAVRLVPAAAAEAVDAALFDNRDAPEDVLAAALTAAITPYDRDVRTLAGVSDVDGVVTPGDLAAMLAAKWQESQGRRPTGKTGKTGRWPVSGGDPSLN